MDDAYRQLGELANAAKQHASVHYATDLSPDDWPALDRILARERANAGEEQIEMLAACYGAWIGCWAVAALQGRWTGLSESAAPRIVVGGVTCSPIDAVRRILLGRPGWIGVHEIAGRLQRWKAQADRGRDGFLQFNAAAWDQREADARFSAPRRLPTDPETALLAIDPWLRAEGIENCDLLCLAAGGGLHGPLHAIAGARVTVVDLSDRQLDHDRRIAEQLGIELQLIRQSIDNLTELSDHSFDIVVQPVSSCYLPDLDPMYREVARVLRPGGLYVSQHKQPASLQSTTTRQAQDTSTSYLITTPQIEGLRLEETSEQAASIRESGTAEFLHSLQAIFGGLCGHGLVIEDVAEPPRGDALAPAGSPEHRASFLPPYLKIKARRRV